MNDPSSPAPGRERRPRVLVLPDPAAVADAAAGILVRAGAAAIERGGRFVVALSGGSTPAGLYSLLATPAFDRALPWRQTHLLWSDDRCVPATDGRSNYRLAEAAGLLRRPFAGVHRMPGELDPEEGAREYERTLRALFARPAQPRSGPAPSQDADANTGTDQAEPSVPRIDVVLLGLGEDGHTASLFPGSPVRGEGRRWVVSVEAHGGTARLSLTLPVLTAAEDVVFLVTGVGKAAITRTVLEGPEVDLPGAAVLWGARAVTLLLDEAAAAGGIGPSGAGGRG